MGGIKVGYVQWDPLCKGRGEDFPLGSHKLVGDGGLIFVGGGVEYA